MRIGYVLKRYPRLSETFIVQEILQMEARGADLVLFPIMDPGEPLQNPAVHKVRAPIHYLQRSFWQGLPRMLRSHGRLVIRHPIGYGRAVAHLIHGSRTLASLRTFTQAGHLASLAIEHEVDHLHAHFAHNPASLARYVNLFTGIPYSFTAHAKDLYLSRPYSLINKAERASFITTCTGFNRQYLCGILPPEFHHKVHLVYHGVDTSRFVPPDTRTASAIPRIVSVGRLVPKKGYTHLVEAARLLQARGIPFRLDIYGGGELRNSLNRQIEATGLTEVVHLHGSCTQEDLIKVYGQSDIFALAPVVTDDGDRDGIPNVLMEAMACGLPPVSTDISGIPELITHGSNGLLAPSGDPATLADALAELLLSPSLRERLGREARASVVRRFDARENFRDLAVLLSVEEDALCESAIS